MENYAVLIAIKWIHLMAAVAWIGGMFTNFFIYMPVLGKVLDPPTMGKLMGSVMKRYKVMVYSAIGVFLITGILMGFVLGETNDFSSMGDLRSVILLVKIIVFVIMLVLVIYVFEVLAPKVAKTAKEGPSPKLARIQKSQMMFAMTGFIMGVIILALSAAL